MDLLIQNIILFYHQQYRAKIVTRFIYETSIKVKKLSILVEKYFYFGLLKSFEYIFSFNITLTNDFRQHYMVVYYMER